jgi:hypothetical protein
MAVNPSIGALRFLVTFAQRSDLQTATPATLRKIERGVQRFTHRESAGRWRVDRESPDWRELEVRRARALQELTSFVDRGLATAGDLHLTRLVIARAGRVRIELLGPDLDLFLYQLTRVLEAVGPGRVLRCPQCRKLFVKSTKKVFCSQACYMRHYRAEQKQEREASK